MRCLFACTCVYLSLEPKNAAKTWKVPMKCFDCRKASPLYPHTEIWFASPPPSLASPFPPPPPLRGRMNVLYIPKKNWVTNCCYLQCTFGPDSISPSHFQRIERPMAKTNKTKEISSCPFFFPASSLSSARVTRFDFLFAASPGQGKSVRLSTLRRSLCSLLRRGRIRW